MRMSARNCLLLLGLLAVPTLPAQPAQAEKMTTSAYPSVGKGARLFVTKSHPSHGDLSDSEFRKLSDAGFTVAVSLWAEDPRVFAIRAANAGLSTMNWNLGLVDKKNDGDSTITRQGKSTRYTTPYSPQAWKELTDMVVGLAKISLENPSFVGVCLDFEIYDPANLDGFCESYDDQSFRAFLAGAGHDVPNPLPAPDARWEWLHKKSLLQMYSGYQADLVAARARTLRKAIDAVNPRFQIGVYGWGVLVPPVTHGLATAQAPALVLDATAYGRTLYPYDPKQPDRLGLKWTKTILTQIREDAYNRFDNVIFLGGHYPQAPGPIDGAFKFTVKQAYDSVAYGDGYWIWTDWETPAPWTDRGKWQDDMVAYFRQANNALDAGDTTWAAREPESIPAPAATPPQTLVTSDGKTRIAWDPRTGKRLTAGATNTANPLTQTGVIEGAYAFRIYGTAAEARLKETPASEMPVKRYPAGHGLSALAIGEADGLPGLELVTLGSGWVKVWDIESQAQLARFYVGTEQKSLGFIK